MVVLAGARFRCGWMILIRICWMGLRDRDILSDSGCGPQSQEKPSDSSSSFLDCGRCSYLSWK